jgi:hypothetical protein
VDTEREAESIAERIIAGALRGEDDGGKKLASVRITTYADAASYALLAPPSGLETWDLHRAINRSLAFGFERHGISVEFVVLNGAEYRRWLHDRADTADARRRYAKVMEQADPLITIERRTLH